MISWTRVCYLRAGILRPARTLSTPTPGYNVIATHNRYPIPAQLLCRLPPQRVPPYISRTMSTSNAVFSAGRDPDVSLHTGLSSNSCRHRHHTCTLGKLKRSGTPLGTLIYTGSLNGKVVAVKAFSLSTSSVALIAQSFLVRSYAIGTFSAESSVDLMTTAVGTITCLFVFATPFLLNILTGRYITHIYYDFPSRTFTAIYYNILLMRKAHRFHLEDVKWPEAPPLLATAVVHGKPMLILEDCITDPNVYSYLMGYDPVPPTAAATEPAHQPELTMSRDDKTGS